MHLVTRFPAAVGVIGLVLALVPSAASQQVARGLVRLAPSSAADLREADALIDRMTRSRELRVRTVEADTLVPGRLHERLSQYYRGIPVFGAEIIRQTAGGLTVSVHGSLYAGIDLDVTPALTAGDVLKVLAGRTDGGALVGAGPELMILAATDEGEYRLVYRASVAAPAGPRAFFVDARTGAIVREYSHLKTQDVVGLPCAQCAVGEGMGVLADRKKISVRSSGGRYLTRDELRPSDIRTFDMNGNLPRTLRVLDGLEPLVDADLGTDADNQWTEGGGVSATVDAHVGAGWTFDYLFRRFGRRGLNDETDPTRNRITSLVHPVRRADLFNIPPELVGLFFINAFYCGVCGPDATGVIVYGEGLPPGFVLAGSRQTVDFFSGALDVVVHELTHGVTDFTSQLIYMNESGALNEAFSDIVATGAEFFYQPRGSGLGMADYLIAEDVIRPGGIRSLADPLVFGHPDHYSRRYTGTEDEGGVHINSLVPSHAFYLAIEGGRNRTSGLSVQGVGAANREQIEKVFYRAFVFSLAPNATFRDARAATIQAARDLYGVNSAAERAVTAAWTAVGVQ